MSGYGMDGHLGICEQQSGGIAYVASLDYMPIISESLNESIEALTSEEMRGRYEEGGHYEGMHNIAGDVVVDVHPLSAGKLLKYWFGQSSGTATHSSFSHSFKGVGEDFDALYAVPPLTIEVYRDVGSAFQYYDMLLNQLVFEWNAGSLVRCTAGFVGGNFNWVAATTPSYDVGSYFPWDTTSFELGGAAIDYATQLTLTLNQNLAAKHTLNNSKFPSRIKRDGFRTAELSGSFLFESAAQALKFRAQTGQACVITNIGETTAQSYNNTMKFDIPSLILTDFPSNIAGPGLVEVGWSGKAVYDTTSATLLEATLVNTVAAY
jgi:hypothetical protein